MLPTMGVNKTFDATGSENPGFSSFTYVRSLYVGGEVKCESRPWVLGPSAPAVWVLAAATPDLQRDGAEASGGGCRKSSLLLIHLCTIPI